MKKAVILILSVLTFIIFPNKAAYAETTYINGYFLYTVSDNSVTITAYTGHDSEVTVPAMIAGNPVNVIAAGAFSGNENVLTINLPDTIMTVEEGAFGAGQNAQFPDTGKESDKKDEDNSELPGKNVSAETVPADIGFTDEDAPEPAYSDESGGYTVVYSSEPAYIPVSDGVTAGKAKKELKIKARIDSKEALVLEWDKAENADKYIIYLLSGGKYEKMGETKTASYTYTGAENGKTYKFMVRSVVKGNISKVSESFKISVTVKRSDVKPVVTASVKNGKVMLKWNAVPGAEKYAVYRVSGGKLKKAASTAKTAVKIKQRTSDTGYAVKAYVNGKWTAIGKSDIVTTE